jgi:nucleotide-binding universal stress UspA family protein
VAQQALELAHSLARDHGAKLVLATILPPPQSYPDLPGEKEYGALLQAAQHDLDALAKTIVDVPVKTSVRSGEAGPVLLAAADEHQADLIVMGTHGRRGVTRLLLGSVAEHLMRHARCPVLTVRPALVSEAENDASAVAGACAVAPPIP